MPGSRRHLVVTLCLKPFEQSQHPLTTATPIHVAIFVYVEDDFALASAWVLFGLDRTACCRQLPAFLLRFLASEKSKRLSPNVLDPGLGGSSSMKSFLTYPSQDISLHCPYQQVLTNIVTYCDSARSCSRYCTCRETKLSHIPPVSKYLSTWHYSNTLSRTTNRLYLHL